MHEVIDSGLDFATILVADNAVSSKWWGQRPAPFGPYAPRGFALCHSPFKASSAMPASSQPFN
jgi:hypothetical protein